MTRQVVAVVLLSCAVSLAAPVPKALKRDDRAALVGEWEEPPEKKRAWWFKEDGAAGGGERPDERTGTYRVDASASPKTLDWSTDGGRTWQLGVYSLEGDVLKVNIAKDAKSPRPETLTESEHTFCITATRKK